MATNKAHYREYYLDYRTIDPSDLQGLRAIAYDYGYGTIDSLIMGVGLSSVQPGICPEGHIRDRCEPDQREGWCEACDAPTVRSVGVLAGLS